VACNVLIGHVQVLRTLTVFRIWYRSHSMSHNTWSIWSIWGKQFGKKIGQYWYIITTVEKLVILNLFCHFKKLPIVNNHLLGENSTNPDLFPIKDLSRNCYQPYTLADSNPGLLFLRWMGCPCRESCKCSETGHNHQRQAHCCPASFHLAGFEPTTCAEIVETPVHCLDRATKKCYRLQDF
jgi:hypothetical protein